MPAAFCLGKRELLEGIEQRDGVKSRQEAEAQKGRGWRSAGESSCDSKREGAAGEMGRKADGRLGFKHIVTQTLNQMVVEKCSLFPVTPRD